MANTKITALTADTSPTSDDLVVTVNDPAGTPANKKVTAADLITKAHGLGNSTVVGVAAGTLTSGTDVAVIDGGTGASTASGARTGLGLVIGTDVLAPSGSAAALTSFPTLNQDTTGKSAKTDALNSATTVVNVAAATAPTANQILTATDSTHATWQTLSGAKQSYDYVVAASGGDYTTLQAALAVAVSGDTIFVRSGTYALIADVTSVLNSITIIGENPETTVISQVTFILKFTGTNIHIENCKFTQTTGGLWLTGANSEVTGNHLSHSGNGYIFQFAGDSGLVQGNQMIYSNTAMNNNPVIIGGGVNNVRIMDNYFQLRSYSGIEPISLNVNYSVFSSNTVYIDAATSGANVIVTSGNSMSITGNSFQGLAATKGILNGGVAVTIIGNIIDSFGTYGISTTANNAVISGNYINAGANSSDGIYINNCGYCVVSGNDITSGFTPTTPIGVRIAGANGDRNTVTGNRVYAYNSGVNISSSGQYNVVTGNNFEGCTTGVVDAGVVTEISGNVQQANSDIRTNAYMKNTSGATINAGNVVTLKAVAAGNEVTTTTTASDNLVLGVAQEAIANNASGYIQLTGKTTLLTVDGTTDIAVGDFLTTFTSAGIARKASVGTLGTTPGDLAFAIALEAYTANDSSGVLDAVLIPPRRL